MARTMRFLFLVILSLLNKINALSTCYNTVTSKRVVTTVSTLLATNRLTTLVNLVTITTTSTSTSTNTIGTITFTVQFTTVTTSPTTVRVQYQATFGDSTTVTEYDYQPLFSGVGLVFSPSATLTITSYTTSTITTVTFPTVTPLGTEEWFVGGFVTTTLTSTVWNFEDITNTFTVTTTNTLAS